MKRKLLPVSLTVLLLIGAAGGCRSNREEVVARVDGKTITLRELERAYTLFQPKNIYKLATREKLQKKLDELIEQQLILLAAEDQGLLDDAEIRDALNEEQELQLYRYALNRIVYEDYFSEDSLRQFYRDIQREVRVRHIFIPLNPIAPPPQRDAVLRQMEKIRKELLDGGDFAQLAKKYSRDRRSAHRGGDLGFIGWHPEALEMAAFSLKKGEISQPVRTEIGYHLLQVTGERPIIVPPYDEARLMILNQLVRARAKQLVGRLDSTANELKRRYHLQLRKGNMIHVVEKLRSLPQKPNEPLPPFDEIFSEEEQKLALATFDGGAITVRDMGKAFHMLHSAEQIGNWIQTTGRKQLFLLEARRRGLDREPLFLKMQKQAVEEFIRKEIENRVIEARANQLAQQQGSRSLRMSDWRRLKKQARKQWLAEIRKQHPVEVNEQALQHLLSRFRKLAG